MRERCYCTVMRRSVHKHVSFAHAVTIPCIQYAYTTGVFKVALPDQWLVIVAGPEQLDELKKFGDDEVSLYGGIDEVSVQS